MIGVNPLAKMPENPIVVSPFAQYIVTQATLNVVQGERYKTIPDEIRIYACVDYGKLAAQPCELIHDEYEPER